MNYTPATTLILVDCSWDPFTKSQEELRSISQTLSELDSLLLLHFPHDELIIITYAAYARLVPRSDVTAIEPDTKHLGSNLHHACILANELLLSASMRKRYSIILMRQQPTAHLAKHTRSLKQYSKFSIPPSEDITSLTLEAMNSMRGVSNDSALFILNPNRYDLQFGNYASTRVGVDVYTVTPLSLSEKFFEVYRAWRKINGSSSQ